MAIDISCENPDCRTLLRLKAEAVGTTDGKLYSTKQIDLTGKLLTLKPARAANQSTLGNEALDADTFEINLGKNPQLIGTDPLVGVVADRTNPSTAGTLRFTRTEPVELPASISQKNDKKKSK